MSLFEKSSLNRLALGLFFLTAGTVGAFFGLGGGKLLKLGTSSLSSSEEKHALAQDELTSSSAAAARAQFKELQIQAETGAIIKIGTAVPVEKTMYTREQWDQILADAPVDLLRKHYGEKVDGLEKKSVDHDFPRLSTLENGMVELESLRHSFHAQHSEQKAYWIAQTRIPLAGKDQTVSLLLKVYDSRKSNGPMELASPGKEESAADLCWMLETFFTALPDSPSAGGSACLSTNLRRKGDRYFMTQLLNLDAVEPYYNYLAVELPFRGSRVSKGSGSVLELLEAPTQAWKAQGSISWTQIEEDEAMRYRAEFQGPGR